MKNLKYILLVGLVSLFISCESDDPTAIADAGDRPTATYTTSNVASSTVETDAITVTYDVVLDKAITSDVTFTAHQIGGNASDDGYKADFVVTNGTVAGFTTTTQVMVTILSDGLPEMDEIMKISIEPVSSGNSNGWGAENNGHLVIASEEVLDMTITNPAPSATGLVVGLNWDQHDSSDLDVFVFDQNGDYAVHGTGDIPEIAELIALDAPDGTYTIGIDPYAIEDDVTNVDLTWHFGEPNGDVTVFDQDFDYANKATVYTIQNYSAWATDAYILATVVKTGSDFVITSM